MDFGISLAPGAESWKIVKRAETAGFARAWFVDSQLINADLFVAMTAAAMMTSEIRLATGMLIPSNRIAPVAANALASLNRLAPGRIDLGIATGFTARRSMGLGPIKRAELAEYIRVVTGLLAGETVDFAIEGTRRKIRFLNPELGQIDIAHPIPLHVSALGPKMRAYVAKLGAAFVMPVGNVDIGIKAVGEIKKAWQAAGRDTNDLRVTAACNGAVRREGEAWDSPRMKAQAGPGAAIILHDLVENPAFGSTGHGMPPSIVAKVEAFRPIFESFRPADARYLEGHRAHLMKLRPDEERLIDEEMIRRFTLSGTVAELRDKLRALRDAGFTHFTTHVRYGQPEMVEDWAEVVSGV
jgi:5,10-methylenetetrahydromethanopterin reductase